MISIKRFWLPPLAHIFPEASLPGADRESSSLLMLHGQGLDPFLYRVVVIFTSRLFEKSDKVGTKKLEHHYPPAFKVMYRESQHLSHVATFGVLGPHCVLSDSRRMFASTPACYSGEEAPQSVAVAVIIASMLAQLMVLYCFRPHPA